MKSRLSGRNFDRHWAHDLDDLDREIIKKPTLRERPEEIPALVDEILRRANREEGWQITGVSSDVLEVFRTYTWEGSDDEVTFDLWELIQSQGWIGGGVELENALYLAAESCRDATIELEDIPQYLRTKKW